MAAGQIALSRTTFADAVRAYATARSLRPTDPDARRSEAKARFLNNDLDQAAALYETLIRELPDDRRLRIQAAQVAMKRGRYPDAVRHLSVVAQAHPDQKKLLELLAEAQQKAGDSKGAKATLRKASEIQ